MIELPWFPKACSPNHRSRSHWPRTNAMKKTREWGFVMAANTSVEPYPSGRLPILLTFHPPTTHDRDKDNLLASCKGYLDGIAQAWGVNDSVFDPRVQIGEPVKGGKIVVTLP